MDRAGKRLWIASLAITIPGLAIWASMGIGETPDSQVLAQTYVTQPSADTESASESGSGDSAVSQSTAKIVASSGVTTADGFQLPESEGEIQQVAGSEGGGLLGGFFRGRNSTEKKTSAEPTGQLQGGSDDVDWSGVPYHSVRPNFKSQTVSTPLKNHTTGSTQTQSRVAASLRTATSKTPVAAQPTVVPGPRVYRNSTVAQKLAVPTPPADTAGATLRRSDSKVLATRASTKISTNRPSQETDFSPISSSRRSDREVVANTTKRAVSSSGSQKPDYSEVVDLVPRVSRRELTKTQTTTEKTETKTDAQSKTVAQVPAKPAPLPAALEAPKTEPKAVAKSEVQSLENTDALPKATLSVPSAVPMQPATQPEAAVAKTVAPHTPASLEGSAAIAIPPGSTSGSSYPSLGYVGVGATPEGTASQDTSNPSVDLPPSPFANDTFASRGSSAPVQFHSAATPIGSGVASRHPSETAYALPSEGQFSGSTNSYGPSEAMGQLQSQDGVISSGVARPMRTNGNSMTMPTEVAGPSMTTQMPSAVNPQSQAVAESAINGLRSERPQMEPTNRSTPGSFEVTSELPGIRVVTYGPESMTIRQTREYEIRVENRGAIDAEGVVVRAMIPDWADLKGEKTTRGEVEKQTNENSDKLVWTIDHLPAGQSEKLFVNLTAARSGSYNLDVDWTLLPRKAVSHVLVHEPKLNLTIDGPDEVVYGQSEVYKVRVLNPGDGVAPNVVFILSPGSTPQTQRIGDIPPGKEAQFDVELTAQDLGDLKIHGLATGDLDLRTEASKTIRVSAAKLEAVITGPETKYQNTEAEYSLELQNLGTATSENVVASLRLPSGTEYLGGIKDATQHGNVLRWEIAKLQPKAKLTYEFRCSLKATGDQLFAFDAKGTAAGQTDVTLITAVESIADLVLSVNDPAAPAPVGSEVTYEIVIQNRGSKAARGVQAIAQFSNGIEPKQVVGHSGEVVTGQVLFDPIPQINPGAQVVLKVVAVAEQAGHHRFRTEITSGEVVLVAEEATHFMSPKSDRVSRRSTDKTLEAPVPMLR
jgi:Domain of unknown function DUF11